MAGLFVLDSLLAVPASQSARRSHHDSASVKQRADSSRLMCLPVSFCTTREARIKGMVTPSQHGSADPVGYKYTERGSRTYLQWSSHSLDFGVLSVARAAAHLEGESTHAWGILSRFLASVFSKFWHAYFTSTLVVFTHRPRRQLPARAYMTAA